MRQKLSVFISVAVLASLTPATQIAARASGVNHPGTTMTNLVGSVASVADSPQASPNNRYYQSGNNRPRPGSGRRDII